MAGVIAGGWTGAAPNVDERVVAIFNAEDVRAAVGHGLHVPPPASLTVVEHAQQVVAGLNHRALVALPDGSRARVTVWERLPYTQLPPEVTAVERVAQ